MPSPSAPSLPERHRDATAALNGAAVELLDAQQHLLARLTPGADVGSRPDIANELTLVAKARSMRLHDGTLQLCDTGGDVLGTLVRG